MAERKKNASPRKSTQREEGGVAHPRIAAELGRQQVEFDHDGIHWIRQESYFLMTLDDAEPFDLQFAGPDGEEHVTAAILLVSNNPYELHRLGSLGTRGVGHDLMPGPAQRLNFGLEDRVLTSTRSVIGVSQ